MEMFSFLIAVGIGLILTYFSMKAQSPVFGLFGGIMLLLTGLAFLSGGMQIQMVELTINETGDFMTQVVAQDIVKSTDVLDTTRFALPIIGLAIYIFYANASAMAEDRKSKKAI